MNRIDVDFNSLDRDGLVVVSRRRADSVFGVGDIVVVFDPSEDDMSYRATIVKVDPTGRGLARVHWQAVTADTGVIDQSRIIAYRDGREHAFR